MKKTTLKINNMKSFYKLENLKGTAHEYRDPLIEGYCLTLDGEEFRVFVANETVGSRRGYFIKIMYHLGLDKTVVLGDEKRFPQANTIFRKYCKGFWKTGRERHGYKFVFFGTEQRNKVFAITIMRQIIGDMLMSSPIE